MTKNIGTAFATLGFLFLASGFSIGCAHTKPQVNTNRTPAMSQTGLMQSASELMSLMEYIGTTPSGNFDSEIELVKRLPNNIVEVTTIDPQKKRQLTRYRLFEHSCVDGDVCLIGAEVLK